MKNQDAIKHTEEISMLSGAPNGLEVSNLNLGKELLVLLSITSLNTG